MRRGCRPRLGREEWRFVVEFIARPVQPAHRSASDLLLVAGEIDLKVVDEPEVPVSRRSSALRMIRQRPRSGGLTSSSRARWSG